MPSSTDPTVHHNSTTPIQLVNEPSTAIGRRQQGDEDSEVDEDEMRDNVDLYDQLKLLVTYRVSIDSVRGIQLAEGTQVKVDIMSWKHKIQTKDRALSQGAATFKQTIQMSTTLEKKPHKISYGRKDLFLKLMRVEDDLILGQAIINLAEYWNCTVRKKFSFSITPSNNSQAESLSDAKFDILITAD